MIGRLSVDLLIYCLGHKFLSHIQTLCSWSCSLLFSNSCRFDWVYNLCLHYQFLVKEMALFMYYLWVSFRGLDAGCWMLSVLLWFSLWSTQHVSEAPQYQKAQVHALWREQGECCCVYLRAIRTPTWCRKVCCCKGSWGNVSSLVIS